APRFSYRTLASVSAAGDESAGPVVGGEASVVVVAYMLISLFRACAAAKGPRRFSVSDEGAAATGRPAGQQGLQLVGALVGIERLGVREETRNVVVGDNAVAAEHLSRPGDGLTRFGRRERLRKRRLLVRQLALVRELGGANHHALAGGDVGEHPGK